MERAKRICEPEDLEEELEHLERAFEKNGYRKQEFRRCIRKAETSNTNENREENNIRDKKAFLPYIPKVTDKIERLLRKVGIKTIFKPTRKIKDCLRSAKDKRDPLATPGIYRIPCTCGKVYIGTTMRSVNTRIKEHKSNCRLGHTEKSAVAEHTLNNSNHRIRFEDTQVLATTNSYYARLYREAIEIHKHKDNFNRVEEALKINRTWVPVLQNAKTAKMRAERLPSHSSQTERAEGTPALSSRAERAERAPSLSSRTERVHKYSLRSRARPVEN